MRTINNNNDFGVNEHYINSYSSDISPLNRYAVNDCIIDFSIEIKDTKQYRSIKFEKCVFKKELILENLNIVENIDFIDCVFKNKLKIENVVINGKARFHGTEFSSLILKNIRFKDLASFFKTKFNQTIIFYKVDFLGTTVFTASIFKKNALFTYTKITDVIIFSRTKFEKGLDLSQAIILGKIKNANSGFNDFEDIKDIKGYDNFRKAFEEDGIIPLNNKRETFRILKKAALDDSNQFKFLEYSKLENETYFKQLKNDWFKRFDNFSIFLLNKISNNHNMSWSRGILFTGYIGFFFFYFALINTSNLEFGFDFKLLNDSIGKYFLFLSPVHDMNLFKEKNISTGTIIFDFLGRIFIGYGIYQTIQAFRKHKG